METLKDKVLKCHECGKDFIWPARYSSFDPILDEEIQKFKRHIKTLIEEGKLDEAERYQKGLDNVNRWSIENGYSDSQEACLINGIGSPKFCHECKQKRIEESQGRLKKR